MAYKGFNRPKKSTTVNLSKTHQRKEKAKSVYLKIFNRKSNPSILKSETTNGKNISNYRIHYTAVKEVNYISDFL